MTFEGSSCKWVSCHGRCLDGVVVGLGEVWNFS